MILGLQPHSDRSLQRHWTVVQIGLFLLPFSAFLGGVAILGTAFAIWKQRFLRLGRQRINQGFALLGLLMVGAACFAIDRPNAFLGLFNFLPFFIIFAALRELIQVPQQLRQIAWIIVLTSVPVSLIGCVQLFLNWGGHPSLLWGLIQWTILPGGNPVGRMASVFTYANVLASYSAIAFILAVGLWVEVRKPIIGAIVVLNAIALILTNSRNAWAIAVVACLAFALYQGWRWIVVGVGAIASVMLGAAFAPLLIANPLRMIVPRFFWARLNDQLYLDRPVAQLRSTQWRFAWSLAQQRPLTGWGLRSFTQLYSEQTQLWLGHPHNLFLMLSAECGLLVSVLFYGLVGWIMAQSVLKYWALKERSIYFTFLIAFSACTLFSFLDITLFDARINLIGWTLLAGISGIKKQEDKYLPVYRDQI